MRPDDYDSTEEVKRAIDGYKQGIPSQREWNGEVIVDAPFYYMLNLQEFLQKYAGKKNQELVNAPQFARQKGPEYGEIKKELLQTKLKTYRDVGWYLSNPTMNFLKWWKEKELKQYVDKYKEHEKPRVSTNERNTYWKKYNESI
jgi:hypothetical protein